MMRVGVFIVAMVFSGQMCQSNPSEDEKGFVGIKISPSEDPKGIKVEGLVENGPAEKAGIKAEDVVTMIDKKAFDNVEDFVTYVRGKKPGDKITMTVIRDKKEKEIEVKVGKAPDPN